MAAIRAKHTEPEMIVRRLLHRAGFRFRLHQKCKAGKPDLTLKKWNAVIEVHGCFFHRHDCHLFSQPSGASAGFWEKKLTENVARDERQARAIAAEGRRRLVVWQCAITGKTRHPPGELVARIGDWLRGGNLTGEIRGRDSSPIDLI